VPPLAVPPRLCLDVARATPTGVRPRYAGSWRISAVLAPGGSRLAAAGRLESSSAWSRAGDAAPPRAGDAGSRRGGPWPEFARPGGARRRR
jgi:hypothetical protein